MKHSGRRLVALSAATWLGLSYTSAWAQSPLYTLHGDSTGSGFGQTVAGAGDVNGDGFDDVLVGAPNTFTTVSNGGAARVYSGMSGAVLFHYVGKGPFDFFGSAVTGIGDLDGDGQDEFAIGMRGDDSLGVNAGTVRIYSGGTGKVLFRVFGDADGDALGSAISGVGDVDDDGILDLAVGIPGSDVLAFDGGGVRVYSGRTGTVILTYYGTTQGERLGTTVAPGGDLDKDSHDDLLASGAKGSVGRVVVVSGKTGKKLIDLLGHPQGDGFGRSIACVGDATGDGVDDFLMGAPYSDLGAQAGGAVFLYSGVDASLVRTTSSNLTADMLGMSVAPAGDVDEDGLADYAVGVPGRDVAIVPGVGVKQPDVGQVRVYSGATGGLIYAVDGQDPGGLFGWSTALVGDANHDGFGDIVSTALLDDRAGMEVGSAGVFSVHSLPLTVDEHLISLSAGGKQTMQFEMGPSKAGYIFWVVGGASGTYPGVDTSFGHLQINVDAYLEFTLKTPKMGALLPPFGITNAKGEAKSAFQVSAMSDPQHAGLTLHHVVALVDPITFQFVALSNAVPLTLLP